MVLIKLARLADMSNNTIINIEAGKQQNPTVVTIKKKNLQKR